MNQAELYSLLESTGIPVTYHSWPTGEAPPLPWLCYLFDTSRDVHADNKNYVSVPQWDVELYFSKKDPHLERKVEVVFDKAEITYSKYETQAIDTNLHMITYTFQTIGE